MSDSIEGDRKATGGGQLPVPPAARPSEVTSSLVETSAQPDLVPHANSHLFGRGLLYVVVWSLQLVAGTIVSPILAYVMGPAEFGSLASAIALHQVLSVLALFGIDQAMVLQRSEDHNDKAARGLVAVGIAMSLVVMLIVGLTGPLWTGALGFGHFSSLVLAVILWTAPGAAVQVMLALLLAEDRLRSFTLVSALSAVGGQFVGIALLFLVHKDATTYAWGGVGSQFLAMFIGIAVTRPSLRGLVDWGVAWRAIKLGVPLAMGGLAFFVLNAGDRIIIQRLLGPVEVGRYQVAYTVGYVVVLLLTFTSSAWTPRFAAVRDEIERTALSLQARDELYRLLIPIVLGITLVAPVALRVVAPASFGPGTLTVVVYFVALSAFPVAASGATGRMLITYRRGKTIAIIAAVSAVANLALNFALIPLMGIAGSAAATFLAFGLLAFLQVRSMPTAPAWRGPSAPLAASIAAVVALAGASILLPQSPAWNIARFVAALACLPWLIVRLRIARRGPQEELPSTPGHAAADQPVGRPGIGTSVADKRFVHHALQVLKRPFRRSQP